LRTRAGASRCWKGWTFRSGGDGPEATSASGLFKTTDGGQNWEKVLAGGEFTGVNEVLLDPRNPDVVYAAAWERLRTPYSLKSGGTGSGLWKSTDGGKTMTRFAGGDSHDLWVDPDDPDHVLHASDSGGAITFDALDDRL